MSEYSGGIKNISVTFKVFDKDIRGLDIHPQIFMRINESEWHSTEEVTELLTKYSQDLMSRYHKQREVNYEG